MFRASESVLLVFDLKRVLGWFPAVGKMCVIYDGELEGHSSRPGPFSSVEVRNVLATNTQVLLGGKTFVSAEEEIHTSELVRDLT